MTPSLSLAVDNTALDRFDLLQARESLHVECLARELVDRVLSQDFADADSRIRARARYLATHAVRSLQDGWERAAMRAAKDAVVRCLKSDCGSAFSGLSPEHYETLASLLVSVALSGYRGVSEGASPMTPGRYLEIVNGEKP